MGNRGDIILIPTSRQHRLCELLMDWAVLVIDSPENKCLHVHKSSVDSTASQLTGASGWEGRSSSSPLQTPSVVNLVCPSGDTPAAAGTMARETKGTQGSVRPGHAQMRCQGIVWCILCSRAEVIWGGIICERFVCKRTNLRGG